MTTECNRVDANDLCPPALDITCVASPPGWLQHSRAFFKAAGLEEVRSYLEELRSQLNYAKVNQTFADALKSLGVEKMILGLRMVLWSGDTATPEFTVGYEHDPGPRKRKVHKRLCLDGHQVTFQNVLDAVAAVIAHAVEEMGKLRAREAKQAKKAEVTP